MYCLTVVLERVKLCVCGGGDVERQTAVVCWRKCRVVEGDVHPGVDTMTTSIKWNHKAGPDRQITGAPSCHSAGWC